jgi:hypothetical protein
MQRKAQLAYVTLVAILVAMVALAHAAVQAGDMFPDFELERTDGSAWRSSSYHGQPSSQSLNNWVDFAA